MQDIDFTAQITLAQREIREAERFVSDQMFIIDIRRTAGYDTLREQILLDQFIETLRRVQDLYESMAEEELPRPVLH